MKTIQLEQIKPLTKAEIARVKKEGGPGGKIIEVGRTSMIDEAGNIYQEGEWFYTIEQKAKWDGIESLGKEDKRLYLSERGKEAVHKRWEKQRQEDETRTGIKNPRMQKR